MKNLDKILSGPIFILTCSSSVTGLHKWGNPIRQKLAPAESTQTAGSGECVHALERLFMTMNIGKIHQPVRQSGGTDPGGQTEPWQKATETVIYRYPGRLRQHLGRWALFLH